MTPDTVGAVIAAFGAAATVLAGVFGLLAWFSRKLDAQFEKIDARFEKIDTRFEKIDTRFEKIDARLDRLTDEVTEVKIAIARLEGPRPGLQFIGSR